MMDSRKSVQDFGCRPRLWGQVIAATVVGVLCLTACSGSTVGTGIAAGTAEPGSSTATETVGQVQHMVDKALAQVGDQYIFGVEVSLTDPDPNAWDSAELTKWVAFQAGAVIPGSSFEQYLDLKSKGLLVPVDQGKNTAGALLFHFSSEPVPGGGRPNEASVALSLGEGRVVEARSEELGVVSDDANDRFEYAALLPGIDYTDGP